MNNYLSGAVGYVILDNGNKKIIVLSDVHDGLNYCIKESVMINDFLKNHSRTSQVLLEEATPEKINELKPLWTGSTHTMDLRSLVMKDRNIIPIDLRPLLLPFSWEIMNHKETYKQMKLHQYLNLIHYFFIGKGLSWKRYILPELNKINPEYKNKLLKHLQEIANEFNEIYTETKESDKTVEFYFKNKLYVLKHINDIVSYIMEWYSIILMINEKQNSIVHLGLAHSDRLIKELKDRYNFKYITGDGINSMSNLSKIKSACVNLNGFNDKYNKKYSLYY